MAKEEVVPMDYDAHNGTYANFIKLAKWGTISLIVVVSLMGLFLV